MGQKVNPHGLRVGVIRDWDSRWYPNEPLVTPTSDSIIGVVKPWEVSKRTIWTRCMDLWYSIKIAAYIISHPF